MITHFRSRKKITGATYKQSRSKRKYEKGDVPTLTRLGKIKIKVVRTKGGGFKARLLMAEHVNLYNPTTREYSITKIKTITENPANRHYVRRNIMTRGTVIDTEAGRARITNRPGQEGVINAVLVK